jgi:Bacteriophage T4-like portal protein (Gp20)
MAQKKSLFDRLKTLFSTNVVVRNVGGKKLKVVDTARYQGDGNPHTSKVIDRYGRLHGTKGTPISVYNQYNSFSATKIDLYTDYEAMDTDAIISSALDIYSDESTLKNDQGDVLTIRTDNDNIRKILRNLFYDVLNIEYNLWPWIRNLCKYGDFYLYLDVKDELGVTNVVPFSPYEMQREEGTDPEHIYMTKFIYEGPLGKGEFQNYEIAHFRLLGDTNFLPYGKSMLEGARKLFKQLLLMEDAMLIHRIMRAPEKRIFKVDIGNIPPAEVDQYMNNLMNRMKKTPIINEQTGDYNLRFNMQNLLEDFYLPVRGGQSGTTIETLAGLQYDSIQDIEYLRSKIFAALKVPKPYLGYDERVEGKATLAALDIRFARTIERIQRIVVSELTKIAIVHLYAQGYENADLVNFELGLTGPSIIYEQEKVALMKERVDLAGTLIEKKLFSLKYIYSNIFNLSEDEAEFEKNEVLEDIKHAFRQKQIENEGNDPAVTKESFGTPHDIASMQVRGGAKVINDVEVPEGGWPGAGRPAKNLNYGTDKSPFGRDPIGMKDVGNTLKVNNSPKVNSKGGSPLSLENKNVEKLIDSMSGIKIKTKKIISESLKPSVIQENEPNLLDENNLLDEL